MRSSEELSGFDDVIPVVTEDSLRLGRCFVDPSPPWDFVNILSLGLAVAANIAIGSGHLSLPKVKSPWVGTLGRCPG